MFGHVREGSNVFELRERCLDELKKIVGQSLLNVIMSEATFAICGQHINEFLVDRLQRFFRAEVRYFKVGDRNCVLVRVADGLANVVERVVKIVETVEEHREGTRCGHVGSTSR